MCFNDFYSRESNGYCKKNIYVGFELKEYIYYILLDEMFTRAEGCSEMCSIWCIEANGHVMPHILDSRPCGWMFSSSDTTFTELTSPEALLVAVIENMKSFTALPEQTGLHVLLPQTSQQHFWKQDNRL